MSERIILRNGRLLTMNDGPVLKSADLWICDGKIEKIVSRSDEKFSKCSLMPDEAEEQSMDGSELELNQDSLSKCEARISRTSCSVRAVDCTGCVIMPGLIDSHVHYDASYMGDFFLANGITSVRNMRGFEGHARWRDEILAGTRQGPYIYSSGPVYDGEDPTIPDNDNVIIKTYKDVDEAIRYTKKHGFLWMKTYPSIEPEIYTYLLKRCREEGLPVCGHMTKKMDHRILADEGYICCEHTSSLPDDPKTIRYLAGSGMWLCPTHVVCETLPDYVWNGKQLQDIPHYQELPKCIRRDWEASNEVIIANYRELNVHPDFQTIIDRGKEFLKYSDRIMAGTDCPYPGVIPGVSMADELEKLVSVYGMTNYAALCAATCNPARHMGIDNCKGRILPGMDTDLVILEASPLENVENVRKIRQVFQGRRSWNKEALQQMLTAVSELNKKDIELITGMDGRPLS